MEKRKYINSYKILEFEKFLFGIKSKCLSLAKILYTVISYALKNTFKFINEIL